MWGFVDSIYRQGMSRLEAKEFVKLAIALACFRDTSSGGVIRLVDITKDSVSRDYVPYDDFKFK